MLIFLALKMTGPSDSQVSKHNVERLGIHSSLWHHVAGTYWRPNGPTAWPGAHAQCSDVRQWGLASRIHANLSSSCSHVLLNLFYSLCMPRAAPSRGARREALWVRSYKVTGECLGNVLFFGREPFLLLVFLSSDLGFCSFPVLLV